MDHEKVIELKDEVIDEIMHRVEKRQELVQEAEEKMEDFQAAQKAVENQIESNQTYLAAVANVNGVSADEYVFDQSVGGLRPLTEEEKRQREQLEQGASAEASPAEKPETTEMTTENAVFYIRQNGPDSVIVPEEESRSLVHEAIEEAKTNSE